MSKRGATPTDSEHAPEALLRWLSCSRTRGAEMAIWAVSGGSKQGECKREEAELQPKYRAGSSARSRGSRTQDASHQSLTRHLECCSGSTRPSCTPLKAIHLRTEKILHRGRSRRSWPSKIHGATPPRNSAAVDTLLRAARASREPQSGIA